MSKRAGQSERGLVLGRLPVLERARAVHRPGLRGHALRADRHERAVPDRRCGHGPGHVAGAAHREASRRAASRRHKVAPMINLHPAPDRDRHPDALHHRDRGVLPHALGAGRPIRRRGQPRARGARKHPRRLRPRQAAADPVRHLPARARCAAISAPRSSTRTSASRSSSASGCRSARGSASRRWRSRVLLGGLAGITAALRQNRFIDHAVMALAMTGIAVPSFVIAPILALVFGLYLGLLPVAGWDDGALRNMVLPVVALALPQIAIIARLTRGGMLEVLRSNFVRTARAKGIPESRVVLRHVLPSAVIPLVGYLGPAIAGIMTGSLVIEMIFNLPGRRPLLRAGRAQPGLPARHGHRDHLRELHHHAQPAIGPRLRRARSAHPQGLPMSVDAEVLLLKSAAGERPVALAPGGAPLPPQPGRHAEHLRPGGDRRELHPGSAHLAPRHRGCQLGKHPHRAHGRRTGTGSARMRTAAISSCACSTAAACRSPSGC